jgi:hypothetical protein
MTPSQQAFTAARLPTIILAAGMWAILTAPALAAAPDDPNSEQMTRLTSLLRQLSETQVQLAETNAELEQFNQLRKQAEETKDYAPFIAAFPEIKAALEAAKDQLPAKRSEILGNLFQKQAALFKARFDRLRAAETDLLQKVNEARTAVHKEANEARLAALKQDYEARMAALKQAYEEQVAIIGAAKDEFPWVPAPQPLPSTKEEIAAAPEEARKVLDEGRKLECIGEFPKAYELYSNDARDKTLRTSKDPANAKLADQIQHRYLAMRFLVYVKRTQASGSPYWNPKDADELEKGRAQMRADYEPYRKLCLTLADIAQPAIAKAGSDPKADKAEYETKVGQTLDAFVALVDQTTPYSKASVSFWQAMEGIFWTTDALRDWDKPASRKDALIGAGKFFQGMTQRLSKDSSTDDFWPNEIGAK